MLILMIFHGNYNMIADKSEQQNVYKHCPNWNDHRIPRLYTIFVYKVEKNTVMV